MKILIVASTTADCYPSLSLDIIKTKEEFDCFMNNMFDENDLDEQFFWDELDYKQVYVLQRFINTSQEDTEFQLKMIEIQIFVIILSVVTYRRHHHLWW